MMDEFTIRCYLRHDFPPECIQWLTTMISSPIQPTGSSSAECSFAETQQQATKPPAITRLARFWISNVDLSQEDWETVIKAVDFSALKVLCLHDTNFSQEQLDLLLGRIGGTDVMLAPLEELNLRDTDLLTNADRGALQAKIHEVAPRVAILGL